MAYTHCFWNLRTVRPQNCLMPGLIFAMTFSKRSSLEKRLRTLFLGASHDTTPSLLPASQLLKACFLKLLNSTTLLNCTAHHTLWQQGLSLFSLLPVHPSSWVKACLKGHRSILLSLGRVPTGTKNIFRLGWTYFIISSGPSFPGHGLHCALSPKTLFLRKVQTAMPGFSFFMSEWLRAWND